MTRGKYTFRNRVTDASGAQNYVITFSPKIKKKARIAEVTLNSSMQM
jgi:hypothetical protein